MRVLDLPLTGAPKVAKPVRQASLTQALGDDHREWLKQLA